MDSTKEITIYDIARILNLSASTVSRGLKDHPAIHKDTKSKILQTARELGYQHNTFASNLRQKKTNTLGVIVPRLNSYFMSTIIAGIERIVNEAGYNLIISQSLESAEKEKNSVETMYNSRTDGLLVSLAYDTPDLKHFDVIFSKKLPLVFFDRTHDHPNCLNVVIDNFKAGVDATSHLIEQGCKKIIHVGGNLVRNVYADRFNGYLSALENADHKFSPDMFIQHALNENTGKEIIQQILTIKPMPDGIFTSNDTSAVAIIQELKKAGYRIPEDIAIVGFNNDPISKVIDPNLSTINYPGEEMGEIAASTLLDVLRNERTKHFNTIILKHELIIRKSSTRLPAS
jgi:LacI family transcriptional regulator